MEGLWVHSAESLALEREGQMLSEARAKALLAKLTAAFEKAGDTVNLLWLKATLAGEDDLKKMAEASGRRVTEFYDAADRRKRAIRRLLAEEHSEPYREE